MTPEKLLLFVLFYLTDGRACAIDGGIRLTRGDAPIGSGDGAIVRLLRGVAAAAAARAAGRAGWKGAIHESKTKSAEIHFFVFLANKDTR